MVQLERTRQGPFTPEDCLPEDKWSDVDDIFDHLALCADVLSSSEVAEQHAAAPSPSSSSS